MVDLIEAYRVLNQSVCRVADDTVVLNTFDVDDRVVPLRMEDDTFSVSTIRQRLDGAVVLAHDLSQYVNRFYSITLDSETVPWLEYLIHARDEQINLTEFGECI